MKTSVGKTKLEIAVGDITQLEVDAVVAPASVELWMDHGVAAAIKAAGGEAVEKEAVLQGPIKVGEAVITTGHDLKARWVLHVVLSESTPAVDAAAIVAATRAALAEATAAAITSSNAGSGGQPASTACAAMPRTLSRSTMVSIWRRARPSIRYTAKPRSPNRNG
mgnify:CR=1 FL=1